MTIDLDHLKRLLASATPRPWPHISSTDDDAYWVGFPTAHDARLAELAVNALPELIAELERLRAERLPTSEGSLGILATVTKAIAERDAARAEVAQLERAHDEAVDRLSDGDYTQALIVLKDVARTMLDARAALADQVTTSSSREEEK